MRLLPLAALIWLAAGCGVAREPLGELPESDVKRPVKGGQTSDGGDHDASERDAGDSVGQAGAPAADGGNTGPRDSGVPAPTPDTCAADSCRAGEQPLEAYCDQEHARCPKTLPAGRDRACSPVLQYQGPLGMQLFRERLTLANGCGGTTIHLRLSYGTVEYHYGGDEMLRAVTTTTSEAGGPCNATVYRYGDSGCTTGGSPQEIPCEP